MARMALSRSARVVARGGKAPEARLVVLEEDGLVAGVEAHPEVASHEVFVGSAKKVLLEKTCRLGQGLDHAAGLGLEAHHDPGPGFFLEPREAEGQSVEL